MDVGEGRITVLGWWTAVSMKTPPDSPPRDNTQNRRGISRGPADYLCKMLLRLLMGIMEHLVTVLVP